MHLFCIEYLPQTFTSTDQTENYDTDDLVAYRERFTAIPAWVVEKYWNGLSFWEDETSAHPISRAL